MQPITNEALRRVLWRFFTRAEVAVWLPVSRSALDALLKRAVGASEIHRIRLGPYLEAVASELTDL